MIVLLEMPPGFSNGREAYRAVISESRIPPIVVL
jgi:hypothetical protein